MTRFISLLCWKIAVRWMVARGKIRSAGCITEEWRSLVSEIPQWASALWPMWNPWRARRKYLAWIEWQEGGVKS